MATENHDQFPHDLSFSGSGDADASASANNTTERSAAANAMAEAAENVPQFGRANPQAGAGGTVGDDDVMNHVYGRS